MASNKKRKKWHHVTRNRRVQPPEGYDKRLKRPKGIHPTFRHRWRYIVQWYLRNSAGWTRRQKSQWFDALARLKITGTQINYSEVALGRTFMKGDDRSSAIYLVLVAAFRPAKGWSSRKLLFERYTAAHPGIDPHSPMFCEADHAKDGTCQAAIQRDPVIRKEHPDPGLEVLDRPQRDPPKTKRNTSVDSDDAEWGDTEFEGFSDNDNRAQQQPGQTDALADNIASATLPQLEAQDGNLAAAAVDISAMIPKAEDTPENAATAALMQAQTTADHAVTTAPTQAQSTPDDTVGTANMQAQAAPMAPQTVDKTTIIDYIDRKSRTAMLHALRDVYRVKVRVGAVDFIPVRDGFTASLHQMVQSGYKYSEGPTQESLGEYEWARSMTFPQKAPFRKTEAYYTYLRLARDIPSFPSDLNCCDDPVKFFETACQVIELAHLVRQIDLAYYEDQGLAEQTRYRVSGSLLHRTNVNVVPSLAATALLQMPSHDEGTWLRAIAGSAQPNLARPTVTPGEQYWKPRPECESTMRLWCDVRDIDLYFLSKRHPKSIHDDLEYWRQEAEKLREELAKGEK